ncbi:hypothetical protein QE363_002015 [Sphingomonas sp. SORGH_AS870]|uniref:hypothetical protein n=1 Tax=Sphingomonas sp. SORGH_AS_0870 TaxID=3041801 RepID=UPI00285D0E77|nr:hypothetical protein [Sphingomonas sp. SORGH_AS_0870]MDR6146222.1 hypothetical protein [Sphingomonas sp. SORGH_AS_0870]
MPMVDYRLATVDDAIGALHVASWHETYTGLLPQEMLASLSADSRAAMWTTVLGAPARPDGTRIYVAESASEMWWTT